MVLLIAIVSILGAVIALVVYPVFPGDKLVISITVLISIVLFFWPVKSLRPYFRVFTIAFGLTLPLQHYFNGAYNPNFLRVNEKGWLVMSLDYHQDNNLIGVNNLHLNSEGFRGRELQTSECDEDKERTVLFLGDSFTYGSTVEDYHNAFVDIVDANGFCTYNTGMSCADLPQYLSIASEMIPKLKPDVVCLMFCEDNDSIYVERKVSKDAPIGYLTRLGFLETHTLCPCRSLSFREAVRTCYYNLNEPDFPLLHVLRRSFLEATTNIEQFEEYCSCKQDSHLTYKYISKIADLAGSNGSRFIVVNIPSKHKMNTTPSKAQVISIADFEVHTPSFVIEDYASGDDGHFNESGHKKMADYLIRILTDEQSTNQN